MVITPGSSSRGSKNLEQGSQKELHRRRSSCESAKANMAAAVVACIALAYAAVHVHAGPAQPESMQAMFDGLKSQITSALAAALSTELPIPPPCNLTPGAFRRTRARAACSSASPGGTPARLLFKIEPPAPSSHTVPSCYGIIAACAAVAAGMTELTSATSSKARVTCLFLYQASTSAQPLPQRRSTAHRDAHVSCCSVLPCHRMQAHRDHIDTHHTLVSEPDTRRAEL